MSTKEFTTIRVKRELHKKLKELADSEKRTILGMIEILIDDRMKGKKWKLKH